MTRPKIHICTPVHAGFTPATVHTIASLVGGGVRADVVFDMVVGSSLIDVARAQLVQTVMRSDSTHLLWLDADVACHPSVIQRLLDADRDVVGAAYPKKVIAYPAEMRAAAARGEEHWEQAGLDFAVGIEWHEQFAVGPDGTAPAEWLAGGCTLVRRGVFERMIAAYPELQAPGHLSYNVSGAHDAFCLGPMSALYRAHADQSHQQGEDVAWCRRARECHLRDGGPPIELRVLIDAHLDHYSGTHPYGGSLLRSLVARGLIRLGRAEEAKAAE